MGSRRCRRCRGSPPQSARQRGVKAREGPSRTRSGGYALTPGRWGRSPPSRAPARAQGLLGHPPTRGRRPCPRGLRAARARRPADHRPLHRPAARARGRDRRGSRRPSPRRAACGSVGVDHSHLARGTAATTRILLGGSESRQSPTRHRHADERIRRKHTCATPGGCRLPPAQMTRLLAVQTSVRRGWRESSKRSRQDRSALTLPSVAERKLAPAEALDRRRRAQAGSGPSSQSKRSSFSTTTSVEWSHRSRPAVAAARRLKRSQMRRDSSAWKAARSPKHDRAEVPVYDSAEPVRLGGAWKIV